MTDKRFQDRVALVTGATRGIGRALALKLAAEGAHVIATGRTRAALEELDDEIKTVGGVATLVRLDLRKGPDIDALGPSLYPRWQCVDIVIANAGILGDLSPIGHITDTMWNEVLSVNLTANLRLIRTLDPLLRASPAGRAVFLTSGITQRPRAYWTAYAASKAGLEAMVRCYADEVANTPVRVNLVNPGATRTGMRAKAFPGEDPMTLPSAETQAGRILELVLPEIDVNGTTVDLSRPA